MPVPGRLLNDLYELDSTSLAWRNLSETAISPPAGRFGHSLAVAAGRLFVYAGVITSYQTFFDSNSIIMFGGLMSYDLVSGRWEDFSNEQGGPVFDGVFHFHGPKILAIEGGIFVVTTQQNKQSSLTYDCKPSPKHSLHISMPV